MTHTQDPPERLRPALEALMATAPDGIVCADEAGRITTFNPAAERMFGYTQAEILGADLTILMPARYHAAHEAGLRRYRETRQARVFGRTLELEAVRADGREFPVEISLSVCQVDGALVFLDIMRDISERHQRERELQLLQTLTRAVGEAEDFPGALAVAVKRVCEATGWAYGEAWLPLPDGTALRCGPVWHAADDRLAELRATSEHLSLTRGTGLPGRVWASGRPEWVPDVSLASAQIFARQERAIAAGLRAGLAVPIVAAGRVEAVLDFFMYQARAEDSRLVEIVTAVAAELGGLVRRRRAEEERNRFFALSLDLLCVAGFDGYFKQLNPAWEATLGYTAAELLAAPFTDFVHPDDRASTAAQAAGLAEGRQAVSFENRYRHRDGTYRWLRWNANADAETQLIFAVARDVTAHKELERIKDEFQAMLIHDLRSPLTSIIGYNDLMVQMAPELAAEQVQDFAGTVVASAERMLGLINDILDLAKLEAGQIQLDVALFRPGELLAAAVAEVRPLVEGRRLRLQAAWPDDLPAIAGDLHKLRQVLANLLHNATKFARTEVRVSAAATESGVEICVADDGPGIPADEVPRLFSKWHQTGLGRAKGAGTGLGLAIVRLLVEAHGGQVYVRSEPDRGSTFCFTLPLGPASATR